MKFYSKKIIKLRDADIHLHYANNRGRGSDNVTITIVKPETPRPAYTSLYRKISDKILDQYRVSGWAGNVNVPNSDIEKFGGLKD